VAIAKEHSQQAYSMHYRHEEPDFAMKGMYQVSISFAVAPIA